jgi:hypothetical protein
MQTGKIKNYLIGGLLCIVLMLAFGIKPVQRVMNEAVKRGTVNAVEICLDYTRGELLSEEAAKVVCASNFQKRLLGSEYAFGRAGPRLVLDELRWGGTLRNDSVDHVTTWVQIAVYVYDENGSEQKILADTQIWLEPMGETEFEVEISDLTEEQINDLDFCDLDMPNPKSCFSWGVVSVKGLSI